MNLPKVSVIVVNWNGKRYLKECFSSLQDMDYPKEKLELIMVDNSSKDGSVEFMKNNFQEVMVIENSENNYCKANNLGIKAAKSDYIALLNNDAVADKYWLVESVKVIDRNRTIGAVGSKIMFQDRKTIQSVGHKPLDNFYWIDEGFESEDIGQYDKLREVTGLCGAAILYRRKCLTDIGLFDEDFVMFLEDVDMAMKCKKKGWKLLYVPKSIVYHKYRGTGRQRLVQWYCERNRLFIISKHFPEQLPKALLTSNLRGKGYTELSELAIEAITKLLKESPSKSAVIPSALTVLTKILVEETNFKLRKEKKRFKDMAGIYEKQLADTKLYYKKCFRDLKNTHKKQVLELIEGHEAHLKTIKNSRGWKFLTAIYKTKKKLGMLK